MSKAALEDSFKEFLEKGIRSGIGKIGIYLLDMYSRPSWAALQNTL